MRHLQTDERHRSYVDRGLATHAARRARGLAGTKPRRGEWRECPLPGCDQLVYLHPGETRAGYCRVAHAVLARFVDERGISPKLYEHWRGGRAAFEQARARLIRELGTVVESRGGHRLTVLGRHAATLAAAKGERVGRPKALSETETARVLELWRALVSEREIAGILTEERRDRDPRAKAVSRSAVHRAVAAANRSKT